MTDQTKSDSVEKIAEEIEKYSVNGEYCPLEWASRLRALPPSATAQEAVPAKFPYQRTFNAIAAAVSNQHRPLQSIGISVAAFEKEWNRQAPPPQPGGEATPRRAYYETHEPPHCPTCGCGMETAAQGSDSDAILELLIAAGHVTTEKVQQARDIAARTPGWTAAPRSTETGR